MEGAIYYVTSRGLQGEQIFKDRSDYRMYLELVSKYKSQHKFKLYSYNLLPDRLELLIETGDDSSISEIMHDLNSLYTKYFNGRHEKHGHVFDARFKSILVEKAEYLLSMTRHIHLKNIDNPYSSFHIYIQNPSVIASPEGAKQSMLKGEAEIAAGTASPRNDNEINIHSEVEEVLDFLKNKNNKLSYERYVLDADSKEIDELEKNLHRAQVLGSEAFQLGVKNRLEQYSAEQKEALAKRKLNPVVMVMAGALVLVATSSAIYLYVAKKGAENKYEILLKQKEQEFAEKTKFENRSPLTLSDLDGTRWEIEGVPASKIGKLRQDHIVFKGGRFQCESLGIQGFRETSYFLVPQGKGVALWQAAQSNAAGDTASWRGTWQGDAMKGVLTIKYAQSATKALADPRLSGGQASSGGEFSFFSVKWSYEKESAWTKNAGENK